VENITTERAVVISLEEPASIAYLNIYDEGDVWEKTRGCEDCPPEWMAKCCKDCFAFVPERGCLLHPIKTKPFECVVVPAPNICRRNCILEFKCVKGPKKGLVRRVMDSGDVFVAT